MIFPSNFVVAAVALTAAAGIYATQIKRAENRGVEKERAGVEKRTKAVDAKAQAARKSVAAIPDGDVLKRWYRD